MMMGTRIQTKSRGTKKPMMIADVDTGLETVTIQRVIARKPRRDKRGFPETLGVPIPVTVQGLVTPTPVALSFAVQSGQGDIMLYFGSADPNDYNVAQVIQYADAVWNDTVYGLTVQQKTDEIQRVLDLERADKNRAGVVNNLDNYPGVT